MKIFTIIFTLAIMLFTGPTKNEVSTPYFKLESNNISVQDVPTPPVIEPEIEPELPKSPIINRTGTKKLSIYNSNYTVPEDLSNKLYEIIQKYPNLNIGIYAISLKDYTCIGYNESFSIDTASSVKAPFALFVMQEIANGNHTFTEKVTYTEKFLNTGSGEIKYSAFGTEYTVLDLITKMINCSDNIAYLMLQDHFGYEGYNEMVSKLGCDIWLNGYTKWGRFTAEELAIIWNEIYIFSKETEEGKLLLDLLIDAQYNFIKQQLGRYSKVAHKSGFNPNAYNDASIIFTESDLEPELGTANDYILVIMTTPGNTGYNSQALEELSKQIDLMMRDLAKYQ